MYGKTLFSCDKRSYKKAFNNYVDKTRGGGCQKVSVFCPRSGYKNCPRRRGGPKNGKILSTKLLNDNLIEKVGPAAFPTNNSIGILCFGGQKM